MIYLLGSLDFQEAQILTNINLGTKNCFKL